MTQNKAVEALKRVAEWADDSYFNPNGGESVITLIELQYKIRNLIAEYEKETFKDIKGQG